jgi:Cu/Ag efflux pump CusA
VRPARIDAIIAIRETAGADLMKRIAVPMVGGLATSFLMELLVYPVLYMICWSSSIEHPLSWIS